MTILKNSEKIIIKDSQDDLNVILEEILINNRPTKQSLDQIEYDLELLNEALKQTDDQNDAAAIAQLIHLIERLLREYLQVTSSIRINRYDRDRLNMIGPSQAKAVTRVLDFWDEHHK